MSIPYRHRDRPHGEVDQDTTRPCVRFPPRLRRWRSGLPDGTGRDALPACIAKAHSDVKRVTSAVSPDGAGGAAYTPPSSKDTFAGQRHLRGSTG